jgi:signal transduction histidine kinase
MPDLQRHTIEVEVPPDLAVRADPQLLENILANLLSNAGQAIRGRPGRIVLRASQTEDETRVEISDDGAGIPDDVLAKLFKPFFTTRAKGTGLGLTIVHKFVEVMGGRIDVETSEGKGTTFTVVLPREMEAA